MSRTSRILIVDDSAEDRELYRRLLRADGGQAYTFLEAEEGEAGLRACETESPDCVLLDYRLPDLDGVEFLSRLRAGGGDFGCAVIVLTGQGNEAVAVEAMKNGAQDYLLKGLISAATLQRAVVNAMEKMTLTRSVRDRTAQLAEANDELHRQVLQRTRAEAALQRMYEDLEVLVYERTAALSHANAELSREISERRRAEDERVRLLVREQEANRLKDEFLATVSHELRTPLNAILGWSRMLREARLEPEMRARALESIERNALSQAKLVEDLLEVSRIVTGKLRLDIRPIDLVSVVRTSLDVVRPAAEVKHVTIDSNFGAFAALLLGDPDRLQQVVWNLLSNAVKFTPAGGTVTVTVVPGDPHELRISDTGKGISEAFLPHVFEPFRQADGSTTRSHGGLGLGLAIVRRLVELHGGSVEAQSKGESQGATFVVRLPPHLDAVAPALAAGWTASSPRTIDLPPTSLSGIKVLVVDDESDARELLRLALSQHGANVTVASSAAEAMAAIARDRPHVLLSDIGMQGEDGYALMRKVRELPPEAGGLIPAVALTAYAGASDRREAAAAGFQAHVAKPCQPMELAQLIATMVPSMPRETS